VARTKREAVVAEQPLHEVGLQTLLEQRESGARADVAAERDAYALAVEVTEVTGG